MPARWSWIFIFNVILCTTTLAQPDNVSDNVVATSNTPQPTNDATTGTYPVTAVDLPARPELVGPIIAAAIVAVFVVVLIVVMIYFYFRGPPPAELEDGDASEKPPVSGRKWFSSKSGRFRNDIDPNQEPVKKLSAVPRYLRAFRRSAGWSEQPVPHTPSVPRSARLVSGDSMLTLSLPPSASPTWNDPFNQMERSDRRKVQVAAQPVMPLPRLIPPRRKRSMLPNFIRYGGTKPSVKREEIVQRLIEKQDAVAQLEEKGRKHAHEAHGSMDSTSTSSTCVVDMQIEQDITELRQEVKVLEQMLPERADAPPTYI